VHVEAAVCNKHLTADWSKQDVAVVGLLFYHWSEAADIEARKQPLNLKSAALKKLLNSKWKPCGKRLEPGQYVRQVKGRRYDFDVRSLLELVAQYRAKTKGRVKLLSHVKFKVNEYYESLPVEFQPSEKDVPLHLFWAKAASEFRPKRRRKPLFRKAKDTTVKPPPPPAAHQVASPVQPMPLATQVEQLVLRYVHTCTYKHTYIYRACETHHTCTLANTVCFILSLRLHDHKRQGARALGERDAFVLRAIMNQGVSDTKLNIVLSLAHLYFFREVIPQDLLWTKGTVSAVINRLVWYEKKQKKSKMQEMVRRFPRAASFAMSDDCDGRHALETADPYIDAETKERTVTINMISVSHYVDKKDTAHAQLDFDTLVADGYPVQNVEGGNTDHPAESEIRKLIALCHANDPDFISRWPGCGLHKNNLLMVWVAKIMCPDKVIRMYCTRQFTFLYRYAFQEGKRNHTKVISAAAEDFMGCKGFWSNVPKIQQDQRFTQ
jgi:hypothetical protein